MVELEAITNSGNTILWYGDPDYSEIITLATVNSILVVPTITTTYYVKALSPEGCAVYDSVMVTVYALPELIIEEDVVICYGDSYTVSATTTEPSDLIRWYRDALYTELIMADPEFTIVITNDTIFYVEAIGVIGCISRGSITISVTLPPSVTAMDDLRICYGEEITLTTISEDGDITWSVPQTTFRPTQTADYVVTASRPPCPDAQDMVRITVGDSLYIDPPTLPVFRRNRYYEQQLLTNAETPLFTVIAGEFPEGLLLHGNGNINGVPPLIHREEKNYTFTVQALDCYDCPIERTYTLRGELFVPLVFSPNGDDINDYFMQGYKVVIFDRLGMKIYEGNDGWDGTYNGNNAPQDTYFYLLFYIDLNGQEAQKTGSVTLFR
jgi:gliding motility-associated-like protein